MAKKKKAIVDSKGFVHFLNDKDGVSEKDYLLLISTGVFFLFMSVGLIAILIGVPLGEDYIKLLDLAVPAVMTVVGGVMGTKAVETYVNRDKKEEVKLESEDEGI
jgi:hypothetical protein